MKALCTTLALILSLLSGYAQTTPNPRRAPIVHYLLTDSTIVWGQLVRQDSAMIVVRKRNGDLTYLEPSQIMGQVDNTSRHPSGGLTSFALKDGATVIGRVMRQTPVAVVVRQRDGTQTFIDPADIVSTTSISTNALRADNELVREDPAATGVPYLLSSRTAYTPRAGQVFYRNTLLVRNEVEVGITDGFSLGVVFNPLLRNFYQTSPFLSEAFYINADFGTQLAARLSFPLGGKVRVGAGLALQLQQLPYLENLGGALTGQVLTTIGGQANNVTLGYTFILGDPNMPIQSQGTLTVGARQRLSPSLTFISDNTIKLKSPFYGPFARLSAALRISRRYHSFDLGLLSAVNIRYIYSFDYSGSYPQFKLYPYLGYIVQLGTR